LFVSCKKEYQTNSDYTHENGFYQKAWDFVDLKNNDSAFQYFNKAKIQYGLDRNEIGIAKSLFNMASIQSGYGDYNGSQDNGIEALKLFLKYKDTAYVPSIYNLLGTNEVRLENYGKSVDYLSDAIKMSNYEVEKNTFLNNKAIAFAKMKKYDSAFQILGLLSVQKIGNVAQYKDNLAFYKWKENPKYSSEKELINALQLREKENDFVGQSTSHAHLADYYFKNDKESSLFHARKMLEVARLIKSPEDELEALEKLILTETEVKGKEYFKLYQKIDDSLQLSRLKAKNEFALVKYESEKQKLENVKKQNQILKQYFAIVGLFIIVVSLFFIINFRKRKAEQMQAKMQLDNEMQLKNTQLLYSKKVHDVVANGLYHTMVEIQNNPNLNNEHILNRIEKMYEESRDIARDDLESVENRPFSEKILDLRNSYQTENQKIILLGNTDDNWSCISLKVQSEVFVVLREALINMKKHSKAELCSIKIEKKAELLKITYTDNGVGADILDINSTSGLRNMENRIVGLNGRINFDKNPNGGFKIQMILSI
jgi:signal transduction histidine kinase